MVLTRLIIIECSMARSRLSLSSRSPKWVRIFSNYYKITNAAPHIISNAPRRTMLSRNLSLSPLDPFVLEAVAVPNVIPAFFCVPVGVTTTAFSAPAVIVTGTNGGAPHVEMSQFDSHNPFVKDLVYVLLVAVYDSAPPPPVWFPRDE